MVGTNPPPARLRNTDKNTEQIQIKTGTISVKLFPGVSLYPLNEDLPLILNESVGLRPKSFGQCSRFYQLITLR